MQTNYVCSVCSALIAVDDRDAESCVEEFSCVIVGCTGSLIRKPQLKRMTANELRDEGYLSEVNRQFFHPHGLAMFVNPSTGDMGVFDDREDPEGWYMGEKLMEDVTAKAKLVRTKLEERIGTRMRVLGYWIQPIDLLTKEDVNG